MPPAGLVPEAWLHVASQLSQLLYPAVLASLGFTALGKSADVHVSSWLVAASSLASIVPFHIGRCYVRQWAIARKAARLGAALPPQWEGKKIGSLDILTALKAVWENGFLSDVLWEKMGEIGYTFTLSILWDTTYVTADVNVVKAVLATDFNSFVKGDKFASFMNSVLGTGVFNSDGDMWKFHRSMTRPFFSRDRISHFELFDRHAEETMNKMKERLRAGYAVDFQDLTSRFTLDSATEFLFGSCAHSLSSVLPYPHHAPSALKDVPLSAAEDFAKAFTGAQDAIAHRARVGWIWPWYEMFGSATAGPMRVVDAFLDPILKEAVEKAKREGTAGSAPKQGDINEDDTLLDYLVRYTSDPVILHDEVLNIMIAGRDTTASMLTIATYFLSQYPDVVKRLRQEILSKVGPTRRPDYDDIRDMKYLRAFINETLRLYPAVPWNLRFPTKDTLIPSSDLNKPYFIPANTALTYSVHCMHRRKDYWGPDAEEFDPDRFLDERLHKYLTPNPFIFLPFNAGPRICLGQQFAYNEMSFFLVRLLQQFDEISHDESSQPPDSIVPKEWAGMPGRKGVERFWPKAHLTLYSKGGLWLKMREAKNTEHV